ncbi:MAG: stress-induced protein [Salinarimonadaceae bacterium]|nr:MAG: stress-induced protein [Salinarimonadaceae bacterium]
MISENSGGKTAAKRGFAAMSAEKRREIASKGGRSVPADKRSFAQDRALASKAGRKGGRSSLTNGNREF